MGSDAAIRGAGSVARGKSSELRAAASAVRGIPAVVAVVAALAFNAAGAASTTVVTRENFFYDPTSGSRVTTVGVGDTVTWENRGEHRHDVTFDAQPWASGLVKAGGSWSHTFSTFGTFTYTCTLHQDEGMAGTVIVTRPTAKYSLVLPFAPR